MEPIIGGGSAKAQPCDAAHAFFRQMTDLAEDYFVGNSEDIFKRKVLTEFLCDKSDVIQGTFLEPVVQTFISI